MTSTKPISTDFPFESNFAEVEGSRIHYVDEGKGDPVLFLHGNPTSSYLWRNIIPYIAPHARAIAPDLIGMGRSDKPRLDYRFHDHSKYVEGFIEKLQLKNVTLVLHDWGSGLGFHYASRHESNVKGLAFMEAMLRPMAWHDFPKDFKMGFKLFRAPVMGWFLNVVMNMFLKQVLPKAVHRKLTPEELRHYREPYRTMGSRKPVAQWPREIPIDGKPADVHTVVASFARWLETTDLPKLLFYASPGGLVTAEAVARVSKAYRNLETVDIGPGIHYLQEDNPHLIGEKLAEWYQKL